MRKSEARAPATAGRAVRVLAGLPRTRPQRASARRVGLARGAPTRPRRARLERAEPSKNARGTKRRPPARRMGAPVPKQGYEAEPDSLERGPVHDLPAAPELRARPPSAPAACATEPGRRELGVGACSGERRRPRVCPAERPRAPLRGRRAPRSGRIRPRADLYTPPRRASMTQVAEGGGPNADRVDRSAGANRPSEAVAPHTGRASPSAHPVGADDYAYRRP